MLWNVLMHGFMGYFGTGWFGFTVNGILLALGIAICTQGVDQFRLRKDYLKKLEDEKVPLDPAELKNFLLKSFAQNTLLCTVITVFIAEFSKAKNIGI